MKRTFTLIELLVVISIIAILAGMLLPALGKAREQAEKIDCVSHLNSFGKAIVMFTTDNKNKLPTVTTSTSTGWVYADRDATNKLFDIDDGSLWKYLNEKKVYVCPSTTSTPLENESGHENDEVSYTFNYRLADRRITSVKKTSAVVSMLEEDEADGYSKDYRNAAFGRSDAASWEKKSGDSNYKVYGAGSGDFYASQDDKLANWHNDQNNLLFLDSHVETVSWKSSGSELKQALVRFDH